jgi:integrase/recombinase XerD
MPHVDSIKAIGKIRRLPVFLIFDEVKRIQNTECRNPEVKKAFLFSSFTGLRFSDIKNRTYQNVVRNKDKYYLNFEQQKAEEQRG